MENNNQRQFCSQNNNENIIGTAPTEQRYLILEVPLPWQRNILESINIPNGLSEILAASNLQQPTRFVALVPDKEYSPGDLTRLMILKKEGELFKEFTRQEFLVPADQIINVAGDLLNNVSVSEYGSYQQDITDTRDLMVCTHGSRDACCSRFGFAIFKQLREKYADEELRVWRASHIIGHRLAPTLVDFPEGRFWGRLTFDSLDNLIFHNQPANLLKEYHRGLGGINYFAQLVEHELFFQNEWQWIKQSRDFNIRMEKSIPEYPLFDEKIDKLQIKLGPFHATVEFYGVTDAFVDCGQPPLVVNQYQVSNLI